MAGNGPATAGRPAAPKSRTVTARRASTRRIQARQHRPRSSGWKRSAVLTAFAAVIVGAIVILAPAISAMTAPGDGSSRLDQIVAAAGFGIDEVAVSGHRYTADSDIFDALDLPHTSTMAALNSAEVQARLRRLPWIATASLTRVFPGRIDVAVTERTPFAAWTKANAVVLVDQTGRELSPVRETDWPALPRLKGDGAPAEAASLYQMLAHFPAIAGRLQLAERVTSRRWQLHLTNGVRLELPPEGEATVLSGLLANKSAARYLDQPGTIIDLRSPARIAARPAAVTSAAVGGP